MSAVSPFGTSLLDCARKVLENAYPVGDGKLAVWLALPLFIWVCAQWPNLHPLDTCHAQIVGLWHFLLFFIFMSKRRLFT